MSRGWNLLVVTGAGTKKVTKLVGLATNAIRRIMILEATHASSVALDAAVILLEPVVQVGARSVPDRPTQD